MIKKILSPYYHRLRHVSIYRKIALRQLYWQTSRQVPNRAGLSRQVRTFVHFIGHGRSGHSIVGALLDAHPNIILPDEVDVLGYVRAGFSRDQIYVLLWQQSQKQKRNQRRKTGRNGKIYSYWVPGQWQGRYEQPQVIGHSKAGVTAKRMAESPALFGRWQNMVMVDLKLIHIVRNPYDNISTIAIRNNMSLEAAVALYVTGCQRLQMAHQMVAANNILVQHHEDLIANPQSFLQTLCDFLGVTTTPDYLDACASIIYHSPAQSRYEIAWSEKEKDAVTAACEQYHFLAGYSYDN